MDQINVLNGILDTNTDELRPHSPEFLSAVQIPVRYDPQATCPASERFVAEVFPEDSIDLAWEIFGDAITPDRSIQKAVLLLGEPGTGKGAFIKWLITFVGRRNATELSLRDLEENRFAASSLQGKLINAFADLPADHLHSTSIFRMLTGGDILNVERKFGDRFDLEPYVRLIFSANHAPTSDDAGLPFFERWIVVPFNQKFRGTDRDRPRRELDATLADPAELSGVLNKALPALRQVRRLNGFTKSKSTQGALIEFEATTDPAAAWLAKETVTHANASVPCDRLLAAYNQNATENRRPLMNPTSFGTTMHRLYPKVATRKRGPRGKRSLHYCGIGLKTDLENPQ
jgi:putative DNA primase/helicase